MKSTLHIPEGIRFLCTGCGHCCHEYPVPLTENDVSRLEAVDAAQASASITRLTEAERGQVGLAAFSHALNKSGSSCSFLSEDRLCLVQDTAKPSMCRLFPYSFLACPDGMRLGVSFASTGVLFNSGPLLKEQQPLMHETEALFAALYPDAEVKTMARWARTQYVEGATIVYDHFLRFEKHYLDRLVAMIESESPIYSDNAFAVLGDMSASLCLSLPVEMLTPLATRFPALGSQKLDQYLLMPFFVAYVAASDEPIRDELVTLAVMTYLQNEDRDLYFVVGDAKVSFAEIGAVQMSDFDLREISLINRFVYVKLFARLYFGPGFSMLTLLTGVFHLAMLLVLVRIALKIDALAGIRQASDERFERLVVIIREMDRRLTAVDYSSNTAAMLELFALDPDRLTRLFSLAG